MDTKQTRLIKNKIAGSNSILILTHTRVDHDAVCSLLLLKHILEHYFDKDDVNAIVQEDTWPQYESLKLPEIDSIRNLSAGESVDPNPFDLVFILDVPYVKRCPGVKSEIKNQSERLIIIDHHETAPEKERLLLINKKLSSTTEQIFSTFREIIPNIIEDETVVQLTQIGMLSDTNRFMHGDVLSADTFRTFGDLYEKYPLNIEHFTYNMTKYPRNCMKILCHVLENIEYSGDMAYSFIDPSFVQNNVCSFIDVHLVKGLFTKTLLRSLDGVNWGFLVYKTDDTDSWDVSFRAIEGTELVLSHAQKLGGGGHEYAAGADVEAKNTKSAVEKVLKAINR